MECCKYQLISLIAIEFKSLCVRCGIRLTIRNMPVMYFPKQFRVDVNDSILLEREKE